MNIPFVRVYDRPPCSWYFLLCPINLIMDATMSNISISSSLLVLGFFHSNPSSFKLLRRCTRRHWYSIFCCRVIYNEKKITYPWYGKKTKKNRYHYNFVFQNLFEPRREKTGFFAHAKTKTQISFAVTAKLISAFVFATRIVQFLPFLNTKFQVSSHLLWLYSPVCVGPGRKPRRPVFWTSRLIL